MGTQHTFIVIKHSPHQLCARATVVTISEAACLMFSSVAQDQHGPGMVAHASACGGRGEVVVNSSVSHDGTLAWTSQQKSDAAIE